MPGMSQLQQQMLAAMQQQAPQQGLGALLNQAGQLGAGALLTQNQLAMLGGLGYLSSPPEPQPIGVPVWVSAKYSVYKAPNGFYLYKNEGWVTLRMWAESPSRATLASTLLDYRARELRINARDMFGMLLGVRIFALGGDLYLRSPVKRTIWKSSQLHAQHWEEAEVVRGVYGIHAAWPPRSFRVTPKIDCTAEDGPIVIAEVRGFGKFVTGKEGWRAEKCAIDRVFLPTDIWLRRSYCKQLEKLYPEVSFEEEPWTLERSSKLAK